ncbi:unnamed protein product, partial [Ectocarpus sp. 6 AP-2014]
MFFFFSCSVGLACKLRLHGHLATCRVMPTASIYIEFAVSPVSPVQNLTNRGECCARCFFETAKHGLGNVSSGVTGPAHPIKTSWSYSRSAATRLLETCGAVMKGAARPLAKTPRIRRVPMMG